MKDQLLVVCHDFRSDALSGSHRVRELVKNLTLIGWKITVVTGSQTTGDTLLDRVQIIHVPFKRPKNLLMVAINRLVTIPDPHSAWVPSAMARIACSIDIKKYSCAIISSPPHSIQRIGTLLKERSKIPWIVDLRDDWMTNHRHRWRTPLHYLQAHRLEREVVGSSDLVLLNTAIVRERFIQRYPERACQFKVLMNGFDEDAFPDHIGYEEATPLDTRLIVYAGDSYGSFVPSMLGKLSCDLSTTPGGECWRIVSMGGGRWKVGQQGANWIHKGMLSQNDVASHLRAAAVLLLPMPPGEREPSGTIPLKTFGYLKSGKPIVYIGERGSTTDLLKGFEGTYSLPRSSWASLGQWIIQNQEQLTRTYSRCAVDEYSYKSIAMNLDKLIRSLVTPNHKVGD